jgi:hypothetical protein
MRRFAATVALPSRPENRLNKIQDKIMAHATDYFDLLKSHISAAEHDSARNSRRETPFTLIDSLIGGDISRIGELADDDDEFDIYRELDALPQSLQRR